jgi:hypothetical protein
MCIFSREIEAVAETKIFARLSGSRQFLVYEMRLATPDDVAMILPLPTKSADERSLSFIDLSRYADFFPDIANCFTRPYYRAQSDQFGAVAAGMLKVHRVGAFEASFVPAIGDFARLDPRFRLPENVWQQLPEYASYGFAVFQLRAGEGRVHPMAFAFETRRPDAIFFPTTHVHDGRVHPTAEFDHALYAQGTGADELLWQVGEKLPSEAMTLRTAITADRSRGIVEPSAPVARRMIHGQSANEDVWV